MKSIWDSLFLFKNHLLPLISIVLPFVLALEVFDAFYVANYVDDKLLLNDTIPLLFIHLLVQPFYSVAIVFYLAAVISAQTITTLEAWLISIKYWPTYLLMSLILNLFVLTGLLVFIIPGVILFIRFSFAEFYLILEKQSPMDAIKSSVNATKDYFLILLTGFLMLGIFTYAPFLMINEFLEIDDNEMSLLSIFISVVFDIVTIIFTIFAYRVYQLSKEKV